MNIHDIVEFFKTIEESHPAAEYILSPVPNGFVMVDLPPAPILH